MQYNKKMRVLFFVISVCFITTSLLGQDLSLDEEELESSDELIRFENFEGISEQIDTDAGIRNIGRLMADQVAGIRQVIGDRYFAYRVIGSATETGRSADIIELASTARVDHIDNFRRIISGYLVHAWGYTQSDADTLAVFISVYNAVYRGNMVYFSSRYRTAVLDVLDPLTAGLSGSYKDWPGQTQLLIPIQDDSISGDIDAVDTLPLIERKVISKLREEDDRGIQKRKDILDLSERVIEERTARIAEDTEALKDAEQLLQEQQAALDSALSQEDDAEDMALLQSEQRMLDERAAELDKLKGDISREQQDIELLTDRVEQLYQETARDQQALQGSLASQVVPFLLPAEDGAFQLSLVSLEKAALFSERTIPIVGRELAFLQGRLVVADRASENLLLLDPTTLSVAAQSTANIFAGARILSLGDSVLTVVADSGQYFIGKFDRKLNLQEQSTVRVDPLTDIISRGNFIVVLGADGTFKRINSNDFSQ